ncbi:MAG: hypothetical protein JWQ56_1292 [Pseudarthrobacter sp.]|nr:hypothetical protein [Pseudarthrobacter sp.]
MGLWAELAGWCGAVIVLAGYAAFSLGWIGSGRIFQLCNLGGSAALLINGGYHGAWPSVALNLAWGGIAAVAFIRFQGMAGRTALGIGNEGAARQAESSVCPASLPVVQGNDGNVPKTGPRKEA